MIASLASPTATAGSVIEPGIAVCPKIILLCNLVEENSVSPPRESLLDAALADPVVVVLYRW